MKRHFVIVGIVTSLFACGGGGGGGGSWCGERGCPDCSLFNL